MRIYPAVHYTMGGLWVDYNLESTIPGLFVLGEANFSDHGANRLGASALMQGLADGYFVIPYTMGNYLAGVKPDGMDESHPECRRRQDAGRSPDQIPSLHQRQEDRRRLPPRTRQSDVGRLRHGPQQKGPGNAPSTASPRSAKSSGRTSTFPAKASSSTSRSKSAGRVADFLELGELMCRDALTREESCGGHFREEYQTADGEALRDDEKFCHAAVWEYQGDGKTPVRHVEPLSFENVHLATAQLQVTRHPQ